MMKCLSFLVLVAVSQAHEHDYNSNSNEDHNIAAPSLIRITLLDDPSLSFKLDWSSVTSSGNDEPILGYKVKVWEQPRVRQYRYETVNGERKVVREYVPSRYSESDEIPNHKPRVIRVNGDDQTSATVDDIETGVTYEARVQAYTRNADGPLSQPMRVQVARRDSESDSSESSDRRRNW